MSLKAVDELDHTLTRSKVHLLNDKLSKLIIVLFVFTGLVEERRNILFESIKVRFFIRVLLFLVVVLRLHMVVVVRELFLK